MRRTQPEEARKLAAAFADPRSGRIHNVRCCVCLGAVVPDIEHAFS
jgi:hypothetical protein